MAIQNQRNQSFVLPSKNQFEDIYTSGACDNHSIYAWIFFASSGGIQILDPLSHRSTGPVSRGDDGAIRHCCKGLLEYHIVSCSIFDSIGPGKYYGNMIYIADGAKYDMVIHGKAQEYSNTMLVLADLGGLALALQTSIYQ
ncbi:hypothetical protein TWF751_001687 [Orbilia oligospora]|nr:hypothetical protein TWF751_001687 [Orbilia oligospora]